MAQNGLARNLLAQVPGRECRHANAARNPDIPQPEMPRHDGGAGNRLSPDSGKRSSVEVHATARRTVELSTAVVSRVIDAKTASALRSRAEFA